MSPFEIVISETSTPYIFTQYYKPLLCKGRANGLRYRRGGRARLAYIIARKLANRAANSWGVAPSGARFVSPFLTYETLP